MADRNIVITGTSRGIGLALARRFAERGERVFALLRNPAAERLGALVRAHPELVVPVTAEVTDPASLSAAAARVAEHAPEGIDVLINNAGVLLSRDTPDPREYPVADLEEALRVNTIGPLRVLQAFLDLLEKRAQTTADAAAEQPNGWRPRVVHVSSIMGSIAGVTGRREYSYSVSKAALNMLGRILSFDLAELGIDSFLIHPGWVRTSMGGPNAQYDEAESAAGIYDRINEWRAGDAPFLDFRGESLQW